METMTKRPASTIHSMTGTAAIESFARGTTIFAAGDAATCFHVLLDGCVALTQGEEESLRLTGRHAFGLEGVINASGVHTCTATALEPCRVATYEAHVLDDVLHNAPHLLQLIVQSLAHQLEASRVKEGSDHSDLKNHFAGEIQTKGPGQWVMRDGEASTEIYRIISTDKGLEVVKNGNQLAVIKEPGEIFGEMAFLLNEGRTAGIKSLGNSVLEVYSPKQLAAMLSDYPDFSLRVITTLAKRLAATSRELAEIKGSSHRDRRTKKET